MTGFRVASYNIHAAVGSDGVYDPERILAVIRETGADVVGLQEVAARPRQTGVSDQFRYFEAETGFQAVAGPNIRHGQSRFGNALLSRWPLRDIRRTDISVAPHEPRGLIEAVLDVRGRPLRVIVTHLGLRRAERRRQLDAMGAAIDRDPTVPTLAMGDLNCWGLDALGLRRRGFGVPGPRVPPTYPAWFPILALDRIWSAPRGLVGDLRAHRSRLARAASDHLPMLAEIAHDAVG